MKKTQFIAALSALLLLTACGRGKTVLVYASNDIQIDESQKNITVTEGTTHHEKMLEFSGSGPVVLNIQSPAGKFTLEAKENGLYIANLKPDTVVGSFQHIGPDAGQVKISTESLQARIDSLRRLIADSNVSASNKNYFIPPGTLVRITDNTNAKIFGPFTTIPSGFDASSVPEIYKFYEVKEEREIMAKLAGILAEQKKEQ